MTSSGTSPTTFGSVRDIANKTVTLVDHVKYDSFGRILYESNQNPKYPVGPLTQQQKAYIQQQYEHNKEEQQRAHQQ